MDCFKGTESLEKAPETLTEESGHREALALPLAKAEDAYPTPEGSQTLTAIEPAALRLFRRRLQELENQERPTTPTSQAIRSLLVGQHRAQLRSNFVETYFPDDANADFTSYFEYVSVGWSSESAITAMDAFQCLYFGTISSDRDLIKKSQGLYVKALGILNGEMIKLIDNKIKPSDEMIAAILACALFERNSNPSFDSTGWQEHTRGLLAVLKAYGPEAINSLGVPFWMKLWQSSLFGYGLLTQKAVFLEAPEWQTPQVQNDRLFNTSIRLPGRLQRLNRNMKPDANLHEAASAVREAFELHEAMHARIMDWSLKSGAAAPFVPVNLDFFSGFQSMLGDLAQVEPVCYQFPGFFSAVTHTTHWLCLLILDQAILDVLEAHPTIVTHLGLEHDTISTFKDELSHSAKSLCKSIPFLSKPELRGFGTVEVVRHLHFLEKHFTRHLDKRHVAWCRKIRNNVNIGYRVATLLASPPDT